MATATLMTVQTLHPLLHLLLLLERVAAAVVTGSQHVQKRRQVVVE